MPWQVKLTIKGPGHVKLRQIRVKIFKLLSLLQLPHFD